MHGPSHEKWTNLGQAYVLVGLLDEAQDVLSQASRVDAQLWQVWRDLMALNAEKRNYETVISSYNKILGLNRGYVDETILGKVTSEIAKSLKKGCGTEKGISLREPFLDLLARILVHNEGNPDVWVFYAVTTASVPEPTYELMIETAERFLKAHSAVTSDEKWFKNMGSALKTVGSLGRLLDAYLDVTRHFGRSGFTDRMLDNATGFAASIADKVKENFSDIVSARVVPTLEPGVLELEKKAGILQSEMSDSTD